MKRTDMVILVQMTDNAPVYRTVMVDSDGSYWIKWNGKAINVNKDIEERHYRLKGTSR